MSDASKAVVGVHMKGHLARLSALGILSLMLDSPAAAQFTTVRPSSVSPAALAGEIETAAANRPYQLQLRFARPTSVGELRAATAELRIPRALAHIEHGERVSGRPRGLVILALGELYAADEARRHSECRALIGLSVSEDALRHSPVDEWPVGSIHVFATAHAVRELLSGRRLPAATVVDGTAARPEDVERIADHVRGEIAQPIMSPANVAVPAQCAQLIAPYDEPVLIGGFSSEYPLPARIEGESFRQYAFRLLGQLPGTAVTISLKLDFPATVDVLAALVRDYGISGMRADLVPEHSAQPVIASAELSVHGAPLPTQVHRVRCQMRLARGEPPPASEWHADWISVSMSAENAVRFLSYPNLAQATVIGSYPLGDLDPLRGYFERAATRIYEMPKAIAIPTGCEDVYASNDRDEVGSIRARPPELGAPQPQ